MKLAAIVTLSALAAAVVASPENRKSQPRTFTVRIAGFRFLPERLEVNAGDTVVWKNEDIVPHTATAPRFDSKSLDKDQTWSWVAAKPGTFPYICKFHPAMRAELIVK